MANHWTVLKKRLPLCFVSQSACKQGRTQDNIYDEWLATIYYSLPKNSLVGRLRAFYIFIPWWNTCRPIRNGDWMGAIAPPLAKKDLFQAQGNGGGGGGANQSRAHIWLLLYCTPFPKTLHTGLKSKTKQTHMTNIKHLTQFHSLWE